MDDIHLPEELALGHSSTLVSEAEEEIQAIWGAGRGCNPRGQVRLWTVVADNTLGLGLQCDLTVKGTPVLFWAANKEGLCHSTGSGQGPAGSIAFSTGSA